MNLGSNGRGTCVVGLVIVGLLVASGCREDRGQSVPPGTVATLPPPPSAATSPSGTADVGPASWSDRPAVEPKGRTVDASIRVGAADRTYHVYEPASLDRGRPVPLVIALHGGGGWGAQFQRSSGFDGIAEANGFVIVYADGSKVPPLPESRAWNGGACCAAPSRDKVDDVGFISALIDEIEAEYRIDPARVYAVGHSNGGIMSYRLACELAVKIVAIGVQSAALEAASCSPSRPVSVLHVHGTADQQVPIDGGFGPKSVVAVDFRPPVDAIHTFADRNGCPSPSGPPPTRDVSGDLTVETWTPCAGGTEVRFVKVSGASHNWMGRPAELEARTGPSDVGLDTSAVIWSFLAQHPRH